MQVGYEKTFTHAEPTSVMGKIIQFPLSRLIVGILFLMPVNLVHFLGEELGASVTNDLVQKAIAWADIVISLALFILLYRLYTRFVEKRPAWEFSLSGMTGELLTGLAIGAGILISVTLILWVGGCFQIVGFNADPMIPINGLAHFTIPAFAEELLFRLLLFRLSEELLGSWIALLIVAAFFGFAHAANPNASLISSVAIAVSAGSLLGAVYMYTRRMWMVFGLHLAWNWVQGSFLGLPVSGSESAGLIQPLREGPEWFTGGAFGVEASVITIVLCLIVAAWMIFKAMGAGQVVSPMWIRKRALAVTADTGSV